jgi:hypothetical protein
MAGGPSSFAGRILQIPRTVTTPTNTSATTHKINQSSATAPTFFGPFVGVRNDGQHH